MVCEWLVTLVGCRIYGKYINEKSESINSFVLACLSYFNNCHVKQVKAALKEITLNDSKKN